MNKMSKNIFVLTTSLLLTACNGSEHESYSHETPVNYIHQGNLFTNSGSAEFTSQLIGAIGVFYGSSNNLNGKIDLQDNVIEFSLDLKTLKTGIAQRDQDMYNTLKVDRYPNATFTGTFEPAYDHNSFEKQTVVASGQFTIHGVTRDLVLEGCLQNKGSRVLLEAEWILNINDYKIEPPNLFLVRIFDEQEIRIKAILEPQQYTSIP